MWLWKKKKSDTELLIKSSLRHSPAWLYGVKMDKDHGKVIRVTGQIVEVEFAENPPDLHDLLILEDDKTTRMEVMRSSGPSTFYSLCFSKTTSVYRGAAVINTKNSITVPVGVGVLGRVMN